MYGSVLGKLSGVPSAADDARWLASSSRAAQARHEDRQVADRSSSPRRRATSSSRCCAPWPATAARCATSQQLADGCVAHRRVAVRLCSRWRATSSSPSPRHPAGTRVEARTDIPARCSTGARARAASSNCSASWPAPLRDVPTAVASEARARARVVGMSVRHWPRLRCLPVLLVFGCVIAGVYGALHDQISFTVSPDYFFAFKFHQFQHCAECCRIASAPRSSDGGPPGGWARSSACRC